ncbi:sugar-binding domain-containing protein [Cohnella sp. GCM10027633]|uniref:glycoside hydrolase family 2 protein n=1 Tax=unclassified Cohnella TaxID=2636738 RepID=UPI00363DCA6E
MNVSLNGKWKVTHVPYNESVADILDETFVPEGWIDAQIPEEIHGTLRKAGIIRGHVYSKDTDEEQWIEEVDWVYHKEFFAESSWKASKVIVEFKGLDTFCDVYLNGVKLGSSRNMHVPFQADIAEALNYGARNVFVVRCYSAVKHVEHMDQKGIFSITTSDRIFARKAQMNYSWDFCGRCVTAGIWKDVTIHSYNDARIESYYLYTRSIEDGAASLGLEVELDDVDGNLGEYSLAVRLEKDSGVVYFKEGSFEDFKSLSFEVENPSLWWPRPYGQPELYDFSLTLMKRGEVIQVKRQKFGIRQIEIIREDQGDGRSFIFAVNGRRLFIRGANWVPTHMVYTDTTDRDYEVLMDYAVEGNISMLRIWGGGIYESPRMFELGDELGIMIWSDFMFSCGIYPQDDEFLANVAAEAEHVVKEYRNCTSLVVWAGDNENGQAFGWAGRPYEFQNDKVSNIVLMEACKRLDPLRFYMPTSPYSPDEFYKGGDNPSSPYQGDQHIYIMSADPGVNEYRDYGKNYYKRIKGFRPRFMSEFGFICLPEKDTFYRFNFSREQLRYKNELVEFLPFSNEYIEKKDHDSTIYYSQVYNSMALKYWIEYFRSLKWTCAGSLYWKFNDPVADVNKGGIFPSHMSTVDMYKLPKMTYYYTRRAYDDLIVVCQEVDGGYEIYACSEILEDRSGKLVVSHLDYSGHVLGIKEWECTAIQDSSTLLCALSADEFKVKDAYNEYLKLEFVSEDAVVDNRYHFTDIHEINKLALGDSGLKIVRAARNGSDIVVGLKTERYARHVRLNILDRRAYYSDNYFEMDAGSEKNVTISLHDGVAGIEDTVLYVEGENVSRMTLPLASL